MATRATTPPVRQPSMALIPIHDSDNNGDESLTPVSDPDDHTYSTQSEQTLKRAIVVKLTPSKRRRTGSSIATYARENAIEASRASRLFPFSSVSSPAVPLNHYLGPIPCLISGYQLLTDCVETCHVIPKAIDHAMVCFKLPRSNFHLT